MNNVIRHIYILASLLLSISVIVTFAGDIISPVRGVVTLIFFMTCPGLSLVTLLSIEDGLMEATLIVALSLSVNTLIATGMLYFGYWSLTLGLLLSVGLTIVGIMLYAIIAFTYHDRVENQSLTREV
ncbi:hypothetical protein [Methylophaga lonarensis]|uniref:hypothetical protein n=1 Tax=Methylophaga lonarensis TaxID=999151 RepID=UPI003D2C991D